MVPLTEPQSRALETVLSIWSQKRMFLLGALALGHHISMDYRESEDLDLAVSLDLDEFPGSLLDLDGWTRHATVEHRFISPEGVRVDVLPAGERLIEQGFVEWQGGHRMNIVGFDLAFVHNTSVQVSPTAAVAVPTAPVLALLKMCAWLDRPAARVKDLEDIAHLLDLYVAEDDDRRFGDEVARTGLRFEEHSHFLLGRDLGAVCQCLHRSHVTRFLDHVSLEQLAACGPNRWRRDVNVAEEAIRAFQRGLETVG